MSLVQKLSGVCWTFTFISLAWLQMSVAVQRRTGCIVPKFRFKPRGVQFGAEGDNVKLRCRIARWSIGTEYFWLKNGKPISTVYVSEEQKIRVKKMRYLMIRRTTVQDNGKYTCVTRNSCGTLNATTELVIPFQPKEPPRIVVNTQRRGRRLITVPVGNSIKMDCSASGYPRPTVKWYKNRRLYTHSVDGPLYLSPYQYVLGLRNVVPRDSGVYTCNVSNAYVVPKPTSIQQKPEPPRRLDRTLIIVPIGNLIRMDCSASGYPRPTIKWYKNGRPYNARSVHDPVYSSSYQYVLSIMTASPDDSGVYTCNVSNAHGWFKHTFEVKVKDRMRSKPVVQTMNNVTALVGTRVIIICKARSDSMPHFQWLHWFMPNAAYSNIAKQSGYEIVKQTPSRYYQRIRMTQQYGKSVLYGVKLIIENVTKSQQGKYSCLAGNDIGYGVQHTYVDVHHK